MQEAEHLRQPRNTSLVEHSGWVDRAKRAIIQGWDKATVRSSAASLATAASHSDPMRNPFSPVIINNQLKRHHGYRIVVGSSSSRPTLSDTVQHPRALDPGLLTDK